MPGPFSIQVTINSKGVQGMKVLGDGWEQPQAYALLEKIGPLVQQLDALVRGESVGEGAVSPKEHVQ